MVKLDIYPISLGVFCKKCGYPQRAETNSIRRYFQGVASLCSHCGLTLDWWVCLSETLSFQALALVGAKAIILRGRLPTNQPLTIDLNNFSVPQDAEIKSINITPQSSVPIVPYIAMGNSLPFVDLWPTIRLQLSARSPDPPSEADVGIFIYWVERSADDLAWDNLFHAFEAFGIESPDPSKPANLTVLRALLYANVAVEKKLHTVLLRHFQSCTPEPKEVNGFLGPNGVNYHYQLKILLPVVSKFYGLPELPREICHWLDKLKQYRNGIGHGNKDKVQHVSYDDVRMCLAAALFEFEYLSIAEEAIEKSGKTV